MQLRGVVNGLSSAALSLSLLLGQPQPLATPPAQPPLIAAAVDALGQARAAATAPVGAALDGGASGTLVRALPFELDPWPPAAPQEEPQLVAIAAEALEQMRAASTAAAGAAVDGGASATAASSTSSVAPSAPSSARSAPSASPSPASPPAAAGPSTSPTASKKPVEAIRARRSLYGGLVEVVVDPEDGSEYAKVSEEVLERSPPAVRERLLQMRQRVRAISDVELFAAGTLAGGIAEVAKVVLLHPLDTLKTRMLWESGRRRARLEPESMEAELDTMRQLVSTHPWDGLGAAMLTAVPQGAAFYGVFEVVRAKLGHSVADVHAPQASLPITLLAVAAAQTAYWAVRSESESLKLLRQARDVIAIEERSSPAWLRRLQRLAGVRRRTPSERAAEALRLRTLPIALISDVPVVVARVCLYRVWREAQPELASTGGLSLAPDILASVAFASLIALVAAPLEAARTRTMQRLLEEACLPAADEAGAAPDDPLPEGVSEQLCSTRSALDTFGDVLKESFVQQRGAGLFRDALSSAFWIGIGWGLTVPVRLVEYGLIRDEIILELFDNAPFGSSHLR